MALTYDESIADFDLDLLNPKAHKTTGGELGVCATSADLRTAPLYGSGHFNEAGRVSLLPHTNLAAKLPAIQHQHLLKPPHTMQTRTSQSGRRASDASQSGRRASDGSRVARKHKRRSQPAHHRNQLGNENHVSQNQQNHKNPRSESVTELFRNLTTTNSTCRLLKERVVELQSSLLTTKSSLNSSYEELARVQKQLNDARSGKNYWQNVAQTNQQQIDKLAILNDDLKSQLNLFKEKYEGAQYLVVVQMDENSSDSTQNPISKLNQKEVNNKTNPNQNFKSQVNLFKNVEQCDEDHPTKDINGDLPILDECLENNVSDQFPTGGMSGDNSQIAISAPTQNEIDNETNTDQHLKSQVNTLKIVEQSDKGHPIKNFSGDLPMLDECLESEVTDQLPISAPNQKEDDNETNPNQHLKSQVNLFKNVERSDESQRIAELNRDLTRLDECAQNNVIDQSTAGEISGDNTEDTIPASNLNEIHIDTDRLPLMENILPGNYSYIIIAKGDNDLDSDENTCADTGCGSSLYSPSDVEMCFSINNSPDDRDISDKSNICVDVATSPLPFCYVNVATSPIRCQETVDAATSPLRKTDRSPFDYSFKTPTKKASHNRNDLCTSHLELNVTPKDTARLSSTDLEILVTNEKSLQLNTNENCNEENSSDNEVEMILNKMKFNERMISPLPSTPVKQGDAETYEVLGVKVKCKDIARVMAVVLEILKSNGMTIPTATSLKEPVLSSERDSNENNSNISENHDNNKIPLDNGKSQNHIQIHMNENEEYQTTTKNLPCDYINNENNRFENTDKSCLDINDPLRNINESQKRTLVKSLCFEENLSSNRDDSGDHIEESHLRDKQIHMNENEEYQIANAKTATKNLPCDYINNENNRFENTDNHCWDINDQLRNINESQKSTLVESLCFEDNLSSYRDDSVDHIEESHLRDKLGYIPTVFKQPKLTKLDKFRKRLIPKSKIRAISPPIKKQRKNANQLSTPKTLMDKEVIAALKNKNAKDRAIKVITELKHQENSKVIKQCVVSLNAIDLQNLSNSKHSEIDATACNMIDITAKENIAQRNNKRDIHQIQKRKKSANDDIFKETNENDIRQIGERKNFSDSISKRSDEEDIPKIEKRKKSADSIPQRNNEKDIENIMNIKNSGGNFLYRSDNEELQINKNNFTHSTIQKGIEDSTQKGIEDSTHKGIEDSTKKGIEESIQQCVMGNNSTSSTQNREEIHQVDKRKKSADSCSQPFSEDPIQKTRKRKGSADKPVIESKRMLRSSSLKTSRSEDQCVALQNPSDINKFSIDKTANVPLITTQNKAVAPSSRDTENVENVKTGDESSCIDPQESLLYLMLNKHVKLSGKNTNIKLPEDTIATISKTIQDEMASILSLPANEIIKHIYKFCAVIQKWKTKYFIVGLMQYLKDPQRKVELDNKITIPFVPTMTKSEQVLIIIIRNLSKSLTGVDIVDCILGYIEFVMFRLNRTPDFHAIECMSRFYAIVCRLYALRSRLRVFMLDAMYCIQFKAFAVVKQCLDVWGFAIPRAHMGAAKSPLMTCIVYLLHFYKCEDPYHRVQNIRHMLWKRYNYNIVNWNETEILKMLEKAIVNIRANRLKLRLLRSALILIAKRSGAKWCQKNIIKKLLLPLIENERNPEHVRNFCIRMLGPLMRPFPVDMKVHSEIAINMLLDMLKQSPSPATEQAIFTSLILMSRHSLEKVVQALLQWRPKEITPDFESLMKDFVTDRPLKAWNSIIPKVIK